MYIIWEISGRGRGIQEVVTVETVQHGVKENLPCVGRSCHSGYDWPFWLYFCESYFISNISANAIIAWNSSQEWSSTQKDNARPSAAIDFLKNWSGAVQVWKTAINGDALRTEAYVSRCTKQNSGRFIKVKDFIFLVLLTRGLHELQWSLISAQAFPPGLPLLNQPQWSFPYWFWKLIIFRRTHSCLAGTSEN